MSVCCECCVLSGRGLCDVLSLVLRRFTECGVSECDREASIIGCPGPLGAVVPCGVGLLPCVSRGLAMCRSSFVELLPKCVKDS
jgi:hypothetical protein